MLNNIAKHKRIGAAAAEAAGNWQNWQNFVWFGSNDVPNSDKVMLGYVTGPQSTVRDMANGVVIAKALEPFMGNMSKDDTKTADHFGADFHGDKNSLKGFMVRVYDNKGLVTDAFRALFDLSRNYTEGCILDKTTFNEVNRREIMRWVGGELPSECEDLGIDYHDDLIVKVTDVLLEDDLEFDLIDQDDLIEAIRAVTDE